MVDQYALLTIEDHHVIVGPGLSQPVSNASFPRDRIQPLVDLLNSRINYGNSRFVLRDINHESPDSVIEVKSMSESHVIAVSILNPSPGKETETPSLLLQQASGVVTAVIQQCNNSQTILFDLPAGGSYGSR